MAIPAKLVEQVMELPEEERRELRELLDGSLGDDAAELGPEWDAELQRRMRDIDEGAAETVSLEEFEAELRKTRAALAAAWTKSG